ncbi:FecR domain-containing protein [Prolixibacteraceae bacterium Z1-6]|uniref:FecR domain-containing protein n=1 Tax=Draconibacterium aestuarii TaxID=2998507 RepID=A0A9X3F6C7_9BACT|nr:FecR domain-containing protein [Prolixibacteraceae bacterium Z1-6]
MQDRIGHILKKGKAENASDLEKRQMYALFHHDENEYELKDLLLQELHNTENPETSTNPFKKLFDKLWSKIEKKKTKILTPKYFISTFGRIAAAVVIGLFMGLHISSLKSNTNPAYYAASAPKGSISEIILPDSSLIVLNAGSSIKYSINGEKGTREVFLDGEAWFDVHKNKKKPFIVHTHFYDVNVTGTQFNVKAYKSEKQVTTTLEEGSVVIQSTEECKLANSVYMVPGEQLTFDKETKNIAIKKINTRWVTAWKDNKLIFVNMSLKELIVLLERKYGVDIEVKNDAIHEFHFDGTFKDETIIEILEILKRALPIDYKIVDQEIEITTK